MLRHEDLGCMTRWFRSTEILRLRAQNDTFLGVLLRMTLTQFY